MPQGLGNRRLGKKTLAKSVINGDATQKKGLTRAKEPNQPFEKGSKAIFLLIWQGR